MSYDRGDLLDSALGDAVLKKDLSDSRGNRESLLDSCPKRIVEADERDAKLPRGLDHVGDLLRVGAADGASENGAILGEEINRPVVDLAVAANHAVRRLFFFRHAEVDGLGLRQHELFHKTPGVQQLFDPFTRRELALGVLFCGRLGVSLKSPFFYLVQ